VFFTFKPTLNEDDKEMELSESRRKGRRGREEMRRRRRGTKGGGERK
jgi:hypothetical protein